MQYDYGFASMKKLSPLVFNNNCSAVPAGQHDGARGGRARAPYAAAVPGGRARGQAPHHRRRVRARGRARRARRAAPAVSTPLSSRSL